MSNDLTFFTNEPGATLNDRFEKILKHTQYFDVLVGFFRTSGFHRLYSSLESVDKIRILVGLNIDRKGYEVIEESRTQTSMDFESHSNTKKQFKVQTITEITESSDTYETEIGIRKFLEFLITDCTNKEQDLVDGGNGKKMEFRVYPSENIHAKVYICRLTEEQLDYGKVITGSSNFSESGLIANREFNVELKNKADVDFALNQFEDLWSNSVDISQEYVDTVQNDTWLREDISPYHLYLKMLYEYLKEDINIDKEIDFYLPEGYLDLLYQKQAVISARKILDAYKGVFIADVVGLGKTFISALLAEQLPGQKLVICPPLLKEYWEETFRAFGVRGFKVESVGKLDKLIRDGIEKYDTIFIDEAHRFRNEYTQGFEKLVEITYGKKVVLVSATPLNNTFLDIFNQIKLFQSPKKSTIPGVPNLEKFFSKLLGGLKKYKKTDPEYMKLLKSGSVEIREKVLKHIMVRRTRSEIKNCFSADMDEQGLFFPNIEDPRRIIYKFDSVTGKVFNSTIDLLKQFKYSRYIAPLYLERPLNDFESQAYRNIGGFMKGILVKRLESSFYAFRKTLARFITSYEQFVEMFEGGKILISKKVDVYELLGSDDEERIQQLIDEEKLQEYNSDDFKPEFKEDLKIDLEILEQITKLWKDVDSDPKLETFIQDLTTNADLKNKKLIIFTESKETGDYLFDNLNKTFPDEVMMFSSHGGELSGKHLTPVNARYVISENYDPNSKSQKDDIRILVSTDVLAEGVNLHRSNIVINYDLPWNPTRVLQRVGRVNRVGTKHKNIFIYNFFPTDESEEQIGLEANIKSKIQAFHDTLGEDAKYLTEEEIVSSHELFGDNLYKKLNNKKTYEGEEEEGYRSELEYLKLIRDIRDNDPTLFEQIKRLPKKSRSSRLSEGTTNQLITFFKKGKLKKFLMSDNKETREIPFFDAVDFFECEPEIPRSTIPKEYYSLLKLNKEEFENITLEDEIEPSSGRGGRSNERYVINRLKVKEFREHSSLTDDDEDYVRIVLERYNEGIIPKNITKRIKKAFEKEQIALKMLAILKKEIPTILVQYSRSADSQGIHRREVILSEYLKGSK